MQKLNRSHNFARLKTWLRISKIACKSLIKINLQNFLGRGWCQQEPSGCCCHQQMCKTSSTQVRVYWLSKRFQILIQNKSREKVRNRFFLKIDIAIVEWPSLKKSCHDNISAYKIFLTKPLKGNQQSFSILGGRGVTPSILPKNQFFHKVN